MSPRQNRRRREAVEPARPEAYGRVESTEEWVGREYAVRAVTGSGATKAYRCPGCDQEIRPATPHLVAWPAGDPDAGHRRHWHTACWRARDRRTIVVRRSRNAPRYG
jgi:hypothetical protein